MITHIQGIVLDKAERSAVIIVGGLGYKVFLTGTTMEKLQKGKEISLWTHLAVREDSQTLYGFPDRDELYFFELLISIVQHFSASKKTLI